MYVLMTRACVVQGQPVEPAKTYEFPVDIANKLIAMGRAVEGKAPAKPKRKAADVDK